MKTAIALGTFDGVHKGHLSVIKAASGFNSIAYTFTIPPKAVSADKKELLMLPEYREQVLKSNGISRVVLNDFEDVRDISAEDFLKKLCMEYAPARIVCGFNYRFGRGALGNTELLRRFCSQKGIEFICCDKFEIDGSPVSSTDIRGLIKQGDIPAANALMAAPFGFEGEVLNGDKRGRTIGFPTINQKFPEMLVTPKFGVYSAEVLIDGVKFKGITNIGVRPTFKTEQVMCETYIKDFSGDIYGKKVTLRPLRFIRAEKEFSSLEELKAAIKTDIECINNGAFENIKSEG